MVSVLQSQAEGVAELLEERATGGAVSNAAVSGPIPGSASLLSAAGGSKDRSPGPVVDIPLYQEPASFTVHENGFQSSRVSARSTVGDALADAGISLNPKDIVDPAPAETLEPGMHVYIDYATRITLVVGDSESEIYTQATVVRDALEEQGVAIEETDVVSPAADAMVTQGMKVSVTMVRDGHEATDEPVPYETEYVYDSTLPDGQTVIQQYGIDGNIHREYAVHLVNGAETGRELVSEVYEAPVPEIVVIGTYVEPAPTPEPVYVEGAPAECATTLNVWATWYTAASAGGNVTATGTGVYKGIVAVDPSVIPLGTRMWIPGYGYGIAADTGGAVQGYVIDLGYGPGDVYDWSSRYLDICILS